MEQNKDVLVILITAIFLRIHYKSGIVLVLLEFMSFDHQSFECLVFFFLPYFIVEETGLEKLTLTNLPVFTQLVKVRSRF